MPKQTKLIPGVVADLPLTAIRPDPDQPRKDFTEAALAELADNIRARGVQQPITVRPDPDQAGAWLIKTGERRWRASALAGRKTVPALLADDASDGLQLAFDQVAENHHRADLNPMEWATFLCRLRDEFGMTVREIEAKLAEQGVHNMQRSYLSNIMRLVNLPDWARDRIRKGTLTAAHGKYLLAGIDSPKVMEDLGRRFKGAIVPTTREIQEAVLEAFERSEIDLNDWHPDRRPKFDKAGCKGCKSLKKIASPYEHDEPGLFCLNATCFEEKQASAHQEQEQKDAKPVTVKPNQHGIVNLSSLHYSDYQSLGNAQFDITACQECPNNHSASHNGKKTGYVSAHCFDMACFKRKTSEAGRQKGRRERIEAHVEAWLRARLAFWLTNYDSDNIRALCSALRWYLALGTPGNGYGNESHGRKAADELRLETLDDVIAIARRERGDPDRVREDIALASLATLSRPNLVRLAKRAGLDVTDFRVDEAYLAILNKDGLRALLSDAGCEYTGPEKLSDLRGACNLRADTIGVPRAVTEFFERGDVSREIDLEEEDDDQVDMFADQEAVS